ncbi:hypothetical protein DOTSEDRAFT_44056 [Dothistroma septosporum NZE10]|uniref:Uncharacterized protein n=1 Tax=Dothistroma septosporum (strain NZE10 / CBS 128990) TaxID=675120 RepID=N1PTY1_DOTSN|nr:hypothetical protein DOTSEDRAFT_44056 [Dothistroma septosporum NZE10]
MPSIVADCGYHRSDIGPCLLQRSYKSRCSQDRYSAYHPTSTRSMEMTHSMLLPTILLSLSVTVSVVAFVVIPYLDGTCQHPITGAKVKTGFGEPALPFSNVTSNDHGIRDYRSEVRWEVPSSQVLNRGMEQEEMPGGLRLIREE